MLWLSLSWSWLVVYLVCSSLEFFVSFALTVFGGSPVPFLGPAHQGLTPGVSFFGVFSYLHLVMPRPSMRRTVTLHVGRVPEVISRPELVRLLKDRFGSWKLLAVQFLPGFKAQLTFDSEEARVMIERNSEIEIDGYPCRVVGGGPRGENVLVFHLPYELDNEAIKVALQQFGPVHSVRHQHHPDTSIHTGTRIVHMIREAPIPRHVYVDGWSAKVWYRGQPVECDICGAGHVSRVCPLRGKCRFCKEEGHFARNCPNRDRADWGEVPAAGAAPANAEEGSAAAAASVPSGGASIDLRDNQLDELSSSVAPGSATSSDSLEGATVVSRVDSLEGATVVSQERAPASQSILADLNVPNSSNSCDAPNSDCIDLSNGIDLFNDRNESDIITLNNNETSTANSNINNESEIHSNDSNGNNGNSESIMHSNDGNSESINVTLPNSNEMVLDNSCDSDSDEIRSDASIASLDVDASSVDSVSSVDNIPLPQRAPRSSRKPVVVISSGKSRSVSPAHGGRSRSPLSSGRHPLPPVVGSRPKSRKS